MEQHTDSLKALNEQLPLREKLLVSHQSIKQLFPFVERIAVALYDPETTVLKSFLHSSSDNDPLTHYQTLIDDAPSLKAILKKGLPRVINKMLTFEGEQHVHTQRLGRSGYAASYTVPMFENGEFFGFIFINSREQDVFTENVLRQIDIYCHMISLMVINELKEVRTLTAVVRSTGHITQHRDPETGSHLDRMSRYSLLIARSLADRYDLDDDYIQHIFMFAPLHDIGKIAIPDHILLKPGPLDEAESVIMRSHVEKGRQMIEKLIDHFSLKNIQHISLLRNIASYHHEAINGSGYPEGMKGESIPLEARIVAVADVFDALTSQRPYKEAWSNEEAITLLKELAGEHLDRECVDALINEMKEVEDIQQRFRENLYI